MLVKLTGHLGLSTSFCIKVQADFPSFKIFNTVALSHSHSCCDRICLILCVPVTLGLCDEKGSDDLCFEKLT